MLLKRTCFLDALSFLLFVQLFSVATAQFYTETLALFGDKLNGSNYDPQIRPLKNQSEILIVDVSFELVSIVEINDVTQSFTANGFIFFSWKDEIIAWDPASYGGVKLIHPIPENIWRPRVVLINTLGERDLFDDDKAPVFIKYNGLVFWVPGSLFPTSCQLDVTRFPYDEQSCTITIVAMTQDTSEMQFNASGDNVLKHFFITHGEWDLKSGTVEITFINTAQANLSTINLNFILKRRPAFLIINVVLPVVFLSFLNIMVFLIPADSGEKISYGITVLLALSVFLSTVSSMLPRSSQNLPRLTIYLFILLIISMLTVLDSIIIVSLAGMEEKVARHQKAKEHLSNAMTKMSVFKRAITSMSKLTSNKVDNSNDQNKPAIIRVASVPEDKDTDSGHDSQDKSPPKDQPHVNRYKIIGKYIDKISFIVFLTIWLVVTLGFMVDIAFYNVV